MTKSTELTVSNVVVMSAADALKAVRSAGNAEHGSHSALAHALTPVLEQAYQGNLDPALVIASQWTDAARKAAAAILAHFSGGALKIKAASEKHKGASLRKGWADTKVDDFNFVDLNACIVATMPITRKGDTVTHRANIYKAAKDLKGPVVKAPDTLEKVEARTVKAVEALQVVGVTDEQVEAAVKEAFAIIAATRDAAIAAALKADKSRTAKKAAEAAALAQTEARVKAKLDAKPKARKARGSRKARK